MARTRTPGVTFDFVHDVGWLHSHGMDRHGLPDLEIRHVPAFLGEAAVDLLRAACEYLINSKHEVRLGDTWSLSPRTTVRFVRPTPMSGNEDHYIKERWQLVDLKPTCECCQLRPHDWN